MKNTKEVISINNDYKKVQDVIMSIVSYGHIKPCNKLIDLFRKKHHNNDLSNVLKGMLIAKTDNIIYTAC